ncbi:TIGR04053 family radical SAM/SPASM domain-containing protein [Bacillus sp. NSP9.1]|uniref:TIGR04053 family radical SAM/SPASM domain-containing protein n=1 Tax=Bacillus sp. NSP9.1 TaxID=1071078 RepID=UPI0003FB8E07|nr:TIGR04053 family radical SAM/SPASM domain-containing protein [Bacillus sp. NSP9.1]QHZ47087.1 radical SAM/SPASM domain-containing protein [Bacillus sp. NSP9.1]
MIHCDFQKAPFIVIWELTRACELKCLHCRASAQNMRDPRELSLQEGKELIDQIHAMNNPLLVLTGGDPLMREDVFDIIEYAVQKGVRISMTPSATPNVTKEAIKTAKDLGLSRWAFSLDGPNREIHDHFRGTDGSFDLTMDAIRHIHAFGLPLQINTVISTYNIDYLEEMAQLIEGLDCVLWSVFFLVPTGRAKREDMISPVQHEKAFLWLSRLAKEAPFDIKTTAAQHYRRVVIQQKMREAKDPHMQIRYEHALEKGKIDVIGGLGRAPKGVNDGNGFMFISHIGDVYPSGLLPVQARNVREQPLADIYCESAIFKDLRNPDILKGKCGVCEFRHVCGGSRSRAYALTGDYLESDPSCIYIPKALR